jgi:TolA-binding protein
MNPRLSSIATLLLCLSLAMPALGKNYFLHSPKLWTPEEKEQYERDNPPPKNEKEIEEKQKDLPKKELTPIKKPKVKEKKKYATLVKNGVPYREVTVKKGDTLIGIARKFSKDGAFYVEVMRFNDLDNPDQLVDGDVIKVPLVREKKAKQAKPVVAAPKTPVAKTVAQPAVFVRSTSARRMTPLLLKPPVTLVTPAIAQAVSEIKQAFANHTASARKKLSLPDTAVVKEAPAETAPKPVATVAEKKPIFDNHSTSGPQLFERAVKAYRGGDCPTALNLFNRFLADYSSTLLAADAHLFIADCYLRLSGK